MRGLLNFDKACFKTDNYFGFPVLDPVVNVNFCVDWFSFQDRSQATVYKDSGIHFYIDDFCMDSLWNNPDRYVVDLIKYGLLIQPDFSLYYNYPVSLQIFNKYRNHWLSCYLSWFGAKVIPNINISTPDCWEWSFLGYPKNSIVAMSDIGSFQDKSDRSVLFRGYEEMLKRLDPIKVIYFSRNIKNVPNDCVPVIIPFGKK